MNFQTKLNRGLSSLVALLFLSACATVPSELRYVEPKLPLGSSNIKGSIIKGKGLLASHQIISVFGIDRQYVKGYDGVPYSKNTRIVEGQHQVTVNFSWGQEYVGQSDVVFTAESFTDYILKFDSLASDAPVSSSELPANAVAASFSTQQAAEKPKSESELQSRAKPHFTIGVWVEELDTGKIVSPKVPLAVFYVPTVYVPIVI